MNMDCLITHPFLVAERDDYGKAVNFGGVVQRVYSPGQMKNLYPNKDYKIVGEVVETPRKNAENALMLFGGSHTLPVVHYRTYSRFSYVPAGYLAVTDDERCFVALLKKRFF